MWVAVDVEPRHDGPFFAGFEFFETCFECAGWRMDERAHLGGEFPGGANAEAFDRVAEHRAEAGVVVDLALEDEQRGSGTLLAAVAERAVENVLHGLIAIGE